MSYQVIARKWRPQTFDEVSGQGHVTTALRNAIRSERVPHAILLTGPRGVGKTTLARLLARCLNCEKGPTDSPCGSCSSCQEISSGHSTDVQEVDAASRTSVDDVRELIESIRYAPSPGKHRIFVVDEVHMLSTAAFNALLKTLEEPPPRSLFVFATTNPEKIPFTVVSRCQRYDLRRIATAEVVARLRAIAEAEGITVSDLSLRSIAREGEGSMRDSQTLLDQVIAFGGTEIADDTVAEVLDLIDRRLLLAVIGACVRGEPAEALEACGHALASGAEPKRLGGALLGLLRDLVVLRVAPKSEELVEGGEEELAELRAIAEQAEPARLRRMFRALVKEQEDLAWAPQPEAVLEMAIVRLATLPSGEDVAQLVARLESLERSLGGGGGGGPSGGSGGGGRSSGSAGGGGGRGGAGAQRGDRGTQSGAGSTRPPPGQRRRSGEPSSSATPTISAAQTQDPVSQPVREPQAQPEAEPEGSEMDAPEAAHEQSPAAAPAVPADAPLEVVFDRLRGFVRDRSRGLFASLGGAHLAARSIEGVRIAMPNAFQARRMRERVPELESLFSEFFGRRTRVEIDCDTDESAESAGPSAAASKEEVRQRRQTALHHPAVNVALRELDAEIVEIRPLGPTGPSGSTRPGGGSAS